MTCFVACQSSLRLLLSVDRSLPVRQSRPSGVTR